MKTVIIGGHGKVALLTAPLLRQAGDEVTSVIRNPDQIPDVEAAGATPLVLDVESASRDQFAAAFAGADAVISSAGAGGGNPQRTYAVDRDAAIRSIDAAEQAGVLRYIMVSYAGASLDHGVTPADSFYPYAQAKAAADEYLRESALHWTILGPSMLTLEAPTGRIRAARANGGDIVRGPTSRGNVARAIAAAFTDNKTIGKTIDFADGDTEIAQALHAA